MNETVTPSIPTEVYVSVLGRTIPIHWNYHAILMFTIWLVLVPVGVIVIRYFKPKPRPMGIRTKISIGNPEWWWFNTHKYLLYFAMLMSLAGAFVALFVSSGFSGSVHSFFGSLTILFGIMQVVSSLLRGTHGGKFYYRGLPDKPETWVGDHYSMTTRRRRFEAYHKTAGYIAGFCAVGAVSSGLMQYPMPGLAVLAIAIIVLAALACSYFEYRGWRHDTYKVCFGTEPDHPHNRNRVDL